MKTIYCIGEAMGEISMPAGKDASVAVGGDVFNTAVYLARLGVQAEFVSAVGDDPFGALIHAGLKRHGVGDSFMAGVAGSTGIYSISTDDTGERSFHYWRMQAPARRMLSVLDTDALSNKAADGVVFLTGITLWVLRDSLDALYSLLRAVRDRGGKIVFDGNYRPRLWQDDPDRAKRAYDEVLALADLALLTWEDEQLLWGHDTPQQCIAQHHATGTSVVVLKRGADACLISDGKEVAEVPIAESVKPVDTTAAGDSFNAGFLAHWLTRPDDLTTAAARGHALAGKVIRFRGAILPDAELATLQKDGAASA